MDNNLLDLQNSSYPTQPHSIIAKYITVNPNRKVSLSKFSYFKPLHLLIRAYQVPVLLICPFVLSRVVSVKLFPRPSSFFHFGDVKERTLGPREPKRIDRGEISRLGN